MNLETKDLYAYANYQLYKEYAAKNTKIPFPKEEPPVLGGSDYLLFFAIKYQNTTARYSTLSDFKHLVHPREVSGSARISMLCRFGYIYRAYRSQLYITEKGVDALHTCDLDVFPKAIADFESEARAIIIARGDTARIVYKGSNEYRKFSLLDAKTVRGDIARLAARAVFNAYKPMTISDIRSAIGTYEERHVRDALNSLIDDGILNVERSYNSPYVYYFTQDESRIARYIVSMQNAKMEP